jgi:hypothetical protein
MSAPGVLKQFGELAGQAINANRFAPMVQAVVKQNVLGDMGMHHLSIPNILKVI